MRGPSARVRDNFVDIYQANQLPQADTNSGPLWTYPPIPTFRRVSCTAQAIGLRMDVDDQERVIQFTEWLFMFNILILVSAKDMIIFKDSADGVHTVFVETEKDNAGRGGAFTIRGLEKI
jgi:hypothetical protein